MKQDEIAHVMRAQRVLALTPHQYDQCRKIGAAARRNAEALCMLPGFQATFDARMAALEKRLSRVLAMRQIDNSPPLAIAHRLGGDPRGSCLVLALEEECRTWGRGAIYSLPSTVTF